MNFDPEAMVASARAADGGEARKETPTKPENRQRLIFFAGIDNVLFYEPNTSMLFADAKQAAADIAAEIQQL